MTGARTHAALIHRDSAHCPENVKAMLGPLHRMGCGNGRTCPTPRNRDDVSPAEYYARFSKTLPGGKKEGRAMYLCVRCARRFAQRFSLEFVEPVARG
jgi:hypothetical protein